MDCPMTGKSTKEKAIVENYDAFEAMLPLLLLEHKGEFALMRNREVAGFFPTASEAQITGAQRFSDSAFSVQKIEEKTIDLGFYSYARYRRVA